jgi:hypothetical protein
MQRWPMHRRRRTKVGRFVRNTVRRHLTIVAQKDAVTKDWSDVLVLGGDGRYYSDPSEAVGGPGYFPLKITNPMPPGVAVDGTSLDANHMMFHAYPGIPYEREVGVTGGVPPYNFSLENAPAGMTIDDEGFITWTAPAADATPTVVVEDANGNTDEVEWTIATATTRFRFCDDSAAGGGNGLIATPYQTLAEVHASGNATYIVYFRTGTYTTDGIATEQSGIELRVVFDRGDNQPTQWLAYPGESPVIDFGSTGLNDFVPRIRFGSRYACVQGFEMQDAACQMFQIFAEQNRGVYFCRNTCHGMTSNVELSNAAFCMIAASINFGSVVKHNDFSDTTAPGMKYYWGDRLMHAFNNEHACTNGSEFKQDMQRFLCYMNTYDVIGLAIGGNMQDVTDSDYNSSGEICFNLVTNAGTSNFDGALRINQNGDLQELYVWRNTLMGRVLLQNVGANSSETGPVDGPIVLQDNVIVNAQGSESPYPYILASNITEPDRITVEHNLTGPDDGSVVDNDGLLINPANVGVYGHQVA